MVASLILRSLDCPSAKHTPVVLVVVNSVFFYLPSFSYVIKKEVNDLSFSNPDVLGTFDTFR